MRYFLVLMIALCAATISGCGGDDGQAAPPATPASTFDQTHGGRTVTPHGEVVSGSAQDMEDGSVQYQTSDGNTWQVKPRPDGTYGEPEPVQ